LVVVRQPDSSFACLPAWMTHETASQFDISGEPHFSLDILRSLRAEVDALLGFNMPRQSENLQLSLFDENAPRIELAAPQEADLAALVEALLRQIAAMFASGENGHAQDHD